MTPSPPVPDRRPARPRIWWIGGAVLWVVLYVVDQATKWWVSTTMLEGERTTVVPGLLWWRYLRNPGAAFSMGESVTWIFTLVMAVVAALVLWYLPKAGSRAWVLALFGLLAGVCGNLTDRLFRAPGFARGYVVDFVSVPHFAIFNVADSCICVSIVVMALLTLRGIPLEGEAGTVADEDAAQHSEEDQ